MKLAAWVFAIGFIVLGVVLFFIHPYAPLFLLLSLLVQLPVVWLIMRSSFKSSYLERAAQRRESFAEDGDAQAWLDGEEAEARSIGYKYWSNAGRAVCALNRADALCALGRPSEAAALLAEVPEAKLPSAHRQRYRDLLLKTEA